MNIRGKNRKSKDTGAKTDLSIPSPRHFPHHMDHPVVGKHTASSSLDLPHGNDMEVDRPLVNADKSLSQDADGYRGEKI